jgi:hypothetical protein
VNNGPWEATHDNTRTQLDKLNEDVSKILRVKNISKILKNHTKRYPYRKMGHVHEG